MGEERSSNNATSSGYNLRTNLHEEGEHDAWEAERRNATASSLSYAEIYRYFHKKVEFL